jgi:hypothetical protein
MLRGWPPTPAELPDIKNSAAYRKQLQTLPDWRIGCIFTGSRHRGTGVARAAVAGTLEAIRAAFRSRAAGRCRPDRCAGGR